MGARSGSAYVAGPPVDAAVAGAGPGPVLAVRQRAIGTDGRGAGCFCGRIRIDRCGRWSDRRLRRHESRRGHKRWRRRERRHDRRRGRGRGGGFGRGHKRWRGRRGLRHLWGRGCGGRRRRCLNRLAAAARRGAPGIFDARSGGETSHGQECDQSGGSPHTAGVHGYPRANAPICLHPLGQGAQLLYSASSAYVPVRISPISRPERQRRRVAATPALSR